jgi:hypothetical protein
MTRLDRMLVDGRWAPSSNGDYRTFMIREPVGPVAALTAGDFPALLPARKLGAALAAGCSVILKPAETTPRTALFLAAAVQDSGLPPGVLNVVTSDPAMISRELLSSAHIHKLSLTGSANVGRKLLALAAAGIRPSTMRLGGHAAALVFPTRTSTWQPTLSSRTNSGTAASYASLSASCRPTRTSVMTCCPGYVPGPTRCQSAMTPIRPRRWARWPVHGPPGMWLSSSRTRVPEGRQSRPAGRNPLTSATFSPATWSLPSGLPKDWRPG